MLEAVCAKSKVRDYFIMNKDLAIRKKTALLADCLSQLPHEEIYVLPVIRDLFFRRLSLISPLVNTQDDKICILKEGERIR
jgi:hypothetical protein